LVVLTARILAFRRSASRLELGQYSGLRQ